MNDDITALRAALFDALRGVKANTLELDKARAINELAKTLVDTAKVEVDYLRATGSGESAFLDSSAAQLPPGITGIIRHRLAG